MKKRVRNPKTTWPDRGRPKVARISPATRKNPAPKARSSRTSSAHARSLVLIPYPMIVN